MTFEELLLKFDKEQTIFSQNFHYRDMVNQLIESSPFEKDSKIVASIFCRKKLETTEANGIHTRCYFVVANTFCEIFPASLGDSSPLQIHLSCSKLIEIINTEWKWKLTDGIDNGQVKLDAFAFTLCHSQGKKEFESGPECNLKDLEKFYISLSEILY